ncbi:glycosyl transferase family protein [Galbibacter marinus]|uniref:Glycosyl transferase family protein n=1 Tax=Galbibacter marinus TaxID=555500 RepID=K2PUQ7_9FLAO|nr:glycosyltransferase family 2 protein [Galbibacter marinus]EKF56395.1 glycosyl transferase family protein [Galbibacter marinus]
MKLSIIIPVYNVEKYIERCIRSCYDQKLAQSEYEILVIDDESPDNSVKIIQGLIDSYSNLKIISQKNKGLGGARNTGIQNAKGRYVLFLDSDDYLLPNVLDKLMEIAIVNTLDIIDFAANGVREDGRVVYSISHQNCPQPITGPEYFIKGHHNSACVRLYRTEFLLQNNLLFKEKVYIEDVEFNFKGVFLAQRIMSTPIVVSNFVQTSDSITRSSNTKKNQKLIQDILKSTLLIDSYSKHSITPNSIAYQKSRAKVNELVISLLKNLFSKSKSQQLFYATIKALRTAELYPVRYISDNPQRNLFKNFANQYWIFKQFYTLKTRFGS